MKQMSQALYINLKGDKAQVFISVLCKVQRRPSIYERKKAKTVCDRDDIKGNGFSFFQFPHLSREGFMDMTAKESRLPLVMSLTKGRKRRERERDE